MMEVEALDFDEYAERSTQGLMEYLRSIDVELTDEDAQQMPSMLRHGLERVRASGDEHWELTYRGAVDVLVERLYYLAHPKDANLLPRMAGSDLHKEDLAFLERLNIEDGEAVALFRICPLWPFC